MEKMSLAHETGKHEAISGEQNSGLARSSGSKISS